VTDESKELTAVQQAVILAILDERTIAGAARKAGVARSTVYLWLEKPAFRAEVGRARAKLFEEGLDLINSNMEKAVRKLAEALDHGSASIRLKAAAKLTELGMQMHQNSEVEAKLKELEERTNLLGE